MDFLNKDKGSVLVKLQKNKVLRQFLQVLKVVLLQKDLL